MCKQSRNWLRDLTITVKGTPEHKLSRGEISVERYILDKCERDLLKKFQEMFGDQLDEKSKRLHHH